MKSRTRRKVPREPGGSFLDGGVASIAAGAAALLACSSPSAPHAYVAERQARSHGGETLQAMLVRVRRGGARDVRFVAPTPETLAAVGRWTREVAAGRNPVDAPSGFAVWGSEAHPDLFALVEDGAPRGSGVYVARRAPALSWMIDVPHSFSDLRTLPIGVALFEDLGAAALLVNSVHRYRGAGCVEPTGRKTCPSDVAHATQTVFQEVHSAFLEARPDTWIVAVHGFAANDDSPDMIVSAAGTDAPAECVTQKIAEALAGFAVALYPRDIQRLGGVTGAQARAARERGAFMIHLELSRRLRDALTDDARLRAKLASALRACAHTVPHGMF